MCFCIRLITYLFLAVRYQKQQLCHWTWGNTSNRIVHTLWHFATNYKISFSEWFQGLYCLKYFVLLVVCVSNGFSVVLISKAGWCVSPKGSNCLFMYNHCIYIGFLMVIVYLSMTNHQQNQFFHWTCLKSHVCILWRQCFNWFLIEQLQNVTWIQPGALEAIL